MDMESYEQLKSFDSLEQFEQPCNDVFRLKLFNENFTRELIALSEETNEWSPGGHKKNIDTRYEFEEAYPTVDVHLYQLGFNETWLQVLDRIIIPLLEKIFPQFNFDYDNEGVIHL